MKHSVTLIAIILVFSQQLTWLHGFRPTFRMNSALTSKVVLFQSETENTEPPTCEPCEQQIPIEYTEDSPTFLVDPYTDPTMEELANSNLIKIVNLETSDQQCNALAWKCLGYRKLRIPPFFPGPIPDLYSNEKVFPKWKLKYPQPPDLIGITRHYDTTVDKPIRDAVMSLMRSIPRDFKGGVRNLESEGFRGYKLADLTPNKTRRAQVNYKSEFL
jgi:hypothetical protein